MGSESTTRRGLLLTARSTCWLLPSCADHIAHLSAEEFFNNLKKDNLYYIVFICNYPYNLLSAIFSYILSHYLPILQGVMHSLTHPISIPILYILHVTSMSSILPKCQNHLRSLHCMISTTPLSIHSFTIIIHTNYQIFHINSSFSSILLILEPPFKQLTSIV